MASLKFLLVNRAFKIKEKMTAKLVQFLGCPIILAPIFLVLLGVNKNLVEALGGLISIAGVVLVFWGKSMQNRR